MRLYPFAAFAALLPCILHAQANPDSPENITVTATRVPTAVENLPAGVTVIDRKTIEERGYVTLTDALAAVPGLRVVQSGGPGAQSSVFIRGAESRHVLVLRDGIPINDPGDPGGAFNFGSDTLNDVERIEVVRGPMSSLYGSGAVGGVINLITRHGRGAAHGHVTLAAGSPRQGLAQADVAGGFGIYDYAADVEGFSTRGFDQTPQRETPVFTNEPDGYRTKMAQVEAGATPFADTRFSALLRARDAKSGYDEGDSVAFDAGNATGYDASLFGRAGLASTLFGDVWRTDLTVSRLQDDRRYTIRLDPRDPNQAMGDSRYHGRRTDVQWNNVVRIPNAGPFTASSVTAGYEHIADTSDTRIDTVSGGYPYISAVRAHDDSDGASFGVQTTLEQRLALTGQLREDSTSVAGSAFTWRFGGVLDVPEIASHLKASYGTSFRAPALYDRYGIDSFGFRGSPSLRPERGQGYDAGTTTDLPFAQGPASVSVTYFRNRFHDLIQTVYAPDSLSSSPVNIARARSQGVETTMTLHVAAWLSADLTYTYTDTRNLVTHAQLLRRPYDQASANMRITPFAGFVVAPELLYVGAFQDYPAGNDGVPGFVVGRSPSGLIVNLDISWQINPALQVFVWGRNLGDSTFEPASGYQTPGTSAMAGMRLGF